MMRTLLPALAGLLLGAAQAPAQTYFDPAEQVRRWYLRYLDRRPDEEGLRTWARMLRRGQDPTYVQAQILGSKEYFRKAGNSPRRFAYDLFRDVTGRTPTAGELDFWTRRARFDDRADVAYRFLQQYAPTYGTWPYGDRYRDPRDYRYNSPRYYDDGRYGAYGDRPWRR